MRIPIGVFAYNRPHHLERCLQAIARSEKYLGKKLPIHIFCDTPKRAEDAEKVAETIQVAKRGSPTQLVIREKNYSFRNISEGISELCEAYGKAIIIEDDVLVAPDFLPFVIRGLETYANNPEVFAITGFMYFDTHPIKPESFFQPFPFCWGWATWKRAWDHFEWEIKGGESYLDQLRNRYRFNCLGSIKFSKMLEKNLSGEEDTWGIRWLYAIHQAGGLVLSPSCSLTWNDGCDEGVHGNKECAREYHIHGTLNREDFYKPRFSSAITLPKKISCDKRAIRLLAITFLEKELFKHKKLSKRLKVFFHKVALLFTPRP